MYYRFFGRKSFLSTLCKYLRKETEVFTDIIKNVFFYFRVKVDNSKDSVRSDLARSMMFIKYHCCTWQKQCYSV